MGLTLRGGSAKACLRSLEGECWIDRESSDASLGTRGSATGSANCSRRLEAPWDKAFRSSARIGRIPRQPTASSLMTGSAKRTFWPAISNRHVIVPPPLEVSFLCSTIQPSSAINARSQSDRHHQEHKQWTGQGGSPQIAHGLPHPDAFEPRGYNRGDAAGVSGR